MKWIGQHIWDFISRFRSDVYLENIDSGTIASGGNLGLDSNNKIVKDSGVGATDLLGAGVDGANNQLLTDDGDGTVTSAANLTWDGSDLNVASSVSGKPLFELKTTNTTKTTSAELQFKKDAADTEDGEVLGKISFYGEDEGNNNTQFAEIVASIRESDEGDEAGILELKVAESDSTTTAITTGLKLQGEDETDGTIDAWIGAGATSMTTVVGNLNVTGTTTTLSSGTSDFPALRLENTNTDATGARIILYQDDDGANNDVLGNINFEGKNADGDDKNFATIVGSIVEASAGNEEGKLVLNVASHDAEIQPGLQIFSGNAEDEVDVTIGNGATSVTTIAGVMVAPSRKYELPSSTVGDYKGGDVYYYGDGSTVKGKIYYIDGTNWTLADADTEAATKGLLAVALGTDPDVDGMLLRGFVTLLTEVEGTEAIGSPLYLSATDSGIATVTVPGSGDFVRVLGYSLHATNNQAYFNPDNTWVERS